MTSSSSLRLFSYFFFFPFTSHPSTFLHIFISLQIQDTQLKPSDFNLHKTYITAIMSGLINKIKNTLHHDEATPNTTSGPHSTDAANKADPRVDSDNSKSKTSTCNTLS